MSSMVINIFQIFFFIQIIFIFNLSAQDIKIVIKKKQVLNDQKKIRFEILNISNDTVYIFTGTDGSLYRAAISLAKQDSGLKNVRVYPHYINPCNTIIRLVEQKVVNHDTIILSDTTFKGDCCEKYSDRIVSLSPNEKKKFMISFDRF